MRPNATAAIVGLAICLPCLIPVLLAVGIGGGAISVAGGWFSDNSLMLGAAAAAAVAIAALGAVIFARRARAASCDTS